MKYLLVIIAFLYLSFSFITLDDLNKEETIKVEVKGDYYNEVFILPKGSTIEDLFSLIELNEEAEISIYSLNQVLYNNEIIIINKKQNKLISINSATVEELITLKGIGEKTAKLIIEYRINNGSFKNIEEIKNVKGIGDKTYEKIKEFITL